MYVLYMKLFWVMLSMYVVPTFQYKCACRPVATLQLERLHLHPYNPSQHHVSLPYFNPLEKLESLHCLAQNSYRHWLTDILGFFPWRTSGAVIVTLTRKHKATSAVNSQQRLWYENSDLTPPGSLQSSNSCLYHNANDWEHFTNHLPYKNCFHLVALHWMTQVFLQCFPHCLPLMHHSLKQM